MEVNLRNVDQYLEKILYADLQVAKNMKISYKRMAEAKRDRQRDKWEYYRAIYIYNHDRMGALNK